jgi:UDPglucose 6-dehydrogenase
VKLTVIGCGYLGATHAAAMAELGHQVLGMDIDPDKVAALNVGRAPFFERGLDDLLAKHTSTGRLKFTTSYSEAAAFADLHFIGVGTPQKPGGTAYDLTHLFSAVRGLAPYLNGQAVIVGKSTVPVGTVPQLIDTLRESAPAADRVEVCWNPEFLRESYAVEDTLHPDRIVLGFTGEGTRAEAVIRQAYDKIIGSGTPVIATDLATAELVKSAANAFLRDVPQ